MIGEVVGQLSPDRPAVGAVAYEQRYEEIRGLEAVPNRVATVRQLVLKRDAGQLNFGEGKFYLLTPIAGRTMGAVFVGHGTFSFSPPTAIEQDRLVKFQKSRSLTVPFSSVVLFFADSTLTELQSKLSFEAGQTPSEPRQRFKEAADFLSHDDSKSFDPDLMAAFLNGESSELFYAHVNRAGGGPLMFMVNPHEVEGVTLAHRVRQVGWTRRSEVICRFPVGLKAQEGRVTGNRVDPASIRNYTITTRLKDSGSGDLSFAADARIDITGPSAMGPWIAFTLFEKLRIDSARWQSGEPATVFKGRDGSLLWIRLDEPLAAGDTRTLNLHYHGDLIDRYGDFFFIKSSAEWYPARWRGGASPRST